MPAYEVIWRGWFSIFQCHKNEKVLILPQENEEEKWKSKPFPVNTQNLVNYPFVPDFLLFPNIHHQFVLNYGRKLLEKYINLSKI